jgi:hypothetical protein
VQPRVEDGHADGGVSLQPAVVEGEGKRRAGLEAAGHVAKDLGDAVTEVGEMPAPGRRANHLWTAMMGRQFYWTCFSFSVRAAMRGRSKRLSRGIGNP